MRNNTINFEELKKKKKLNKNDLKAKNKNLDILEIFKVQYNEKIAQQPIVLTIRREDFPYFIEPFSKVKKEWEQNIEALNSLDNANVIISPQCNADFYNGLKKLWLKAEEQFFKENFKLIVIEVNFWQLDMYISVVEEETYRLEHCIDNNDEVDRENLKKYNVISKTYKLWNNIYEDRKGHVMRPIKP